MESGENFIGIFNYKSIQNFIWNYYLIKSLKLTFVLERTRFELFLNNYGEILVEKNWERGREISRTLCPQNALFCGRFFPTLDISIRKYLFERLSKFSPRKWILKNYFCSLSERSRCEHAHGDWSLKWNSSNHSCCSWKLDFLLKFWRN